MRKTMHLSDEPYFFLSAQLLGVTSNEVTPFFFINQYQSIMFLFYLYAPVLQSYVH
jgi:hypothetical protein